jgi:small Trp-rich protein
MYFLLAGVILLVLKVLEIGPVGQWAWGDKWWVFAAPFALAVAWWAYADASGYTKKREMDRLDEKKRERINKTRANLGMAPKAGKR